MLRKDRAFFPGHTGPLAEIARFAPARAIARPTLPPSRGEALRPSDFSHRLRDEKSLVYSIVDVNLALR